MSKITPKIHYRIIAKFSFPSLLDYPNRNLLEGKNKKIIKQSSKLWIAEGNFAKTSPGYFKSEKDTLEFLFKPKLYSLTGKAKTHEEIERNGLTHFRPYEWDIRWNFSRSSLKYIDPVRSGKFRPDKITITLGKNEWSSAQDWNNKCIVELDIEDVRLLCIDVSSEKRYKDLYWSILLHPKTLTL